MDLDITEKIQPISNKLLYKTQKFKAINILRTQKGSINFDTELGIDLKFFLDDNDINFQTNSFKSYCSQELIKQGINLQKIIIEDKNSFEDYFNIFIGD